MQILCILLAFMMVSVPAEARVIFRTPTVEELAAIYPPEMLFKGKPLSPTCVEASNPTEGPTVPQDLKTCDKAPEGQEIEGGLQIMKDGMVGHNYYCGEGPSYGFCGYSGYKYLGKLKDGFALETLSHSGGTGQFSSIVLLKREGDTITTDLIHPTGDRCNGGVVSAAVKDGVAEYGYNASLSELYETYKGDGSFAPSAGSAIDCTAVIRKKGDAIASIDFIRTEEQLKQDLYCFSGPYREYTKSGTSLSEEQVKKFFVRVEEKCAREK